MKPNEREGRGRWLVEGEGGKSRSGCWAFLNTLWVLEAVRKRSQFLQAFSLGHLFSGKFERSWKSRCRAKKHKVASCRSCPLRGLCVILHEQRWDSREVTVHSALRLPFSSSFTAACVPSIHERVLTCTVTHMLLTVQPGDRPQSSCGGLAAGRWRGQLPGQPDLRRHEAARVDSSALGATSSVSATILVHCAHPCSYPVPVRWNTSPGSLTGCLITGIQQLNGLRVIQWHRSDFPQISWTLELSAGPRLACRGQSRDVRGLRNPDHPPG